ncbi:Non-hem dioxygenase N-terminal domain - like 10 [Theobroma cacao]|nr:Non-hem dioxygenase N-terminal domain - like 10 [Theobroma cacao]
MSLSLVEKVKTEIQDFFNLPMEEKKKYWLYPGDVEGFGQAFVVSDEQKLDWGDMFFLTTLPVYSRKPHLFPKLPLPFRDTLNQYSLELEKLAMAILVQKAEAINMNVEEMREFFEGGLQSMRTNYYPPCGEPEQIITNVVYRSIEHRATVNSEKERLSIATFYSPNYNGEVGPAPSLISEGNQALNGAYGSIEHPAIVNRNEKDSLLPQSIGLDKTVK